ncbi:PAS domain-containing protein [Acidimangrovimonas sediminis]|uniref:PAS domain-containing protein n=1 Tax=Acidimangrovimonas sediminis TaxID=2056283 RepID=UPI000C80A757|nr:PAS domain-containing protein [Acidimangrovimonas sediminis]
MPVSKNFALPDTLIEYCEHSSIALTVADAMREDQPLVLANDTFLRLVGYGADEVLERNCRFLQGPDTGEDERAKVSAFIHDDTIEAQRFRIVNHRKDGTSFDNFLFMSRLRDELGETRLFLGAQFDLTKAQRRSTVVHYNDDLEKNVSDINAVSKGFGMAMIDSAGVISRSISMLATMAFRQS